LDEGDYTLVLTTPVDEEGPMENRTPIEPGAINEGLMPATVLMVQVDVGEGAGFSLNFFWATDDYPESLFRAIVDSVKIDGLIPADSHVAPEQRFLATRCNTCVPE
jgi:hypothetical protein